MTIPIELQAPNIEPHRQSATGVEYVHTFDSGKPGPHVEKIQRLGDNDNSIGVGLGLSVARGFVEAMDGTLSATDTPGGGLTVEIDLAAPPKGASA